MLHEEVFPGGQGQPVSVLPAEPRPQTEDQVRAAPGDGGRSSLTPSRDDCNVIAMADKDHVIVTFYQRNPESAPITHAYGPYTKARARRERREISESYMLDIAEGRFRVSACKVIDPDMISPAIRQER